MFVKQISVSKALELAAKGREILVMEPATSEPTKWTDYEPNTLSRMLDGCLFFGKEPGEIKQEQGWIPVVERMPDEDGFYLVSLNIDTNIDEMKVSKAWFGEKTRAFTEYGKAVIAWRPLPEPYRSKDEMRGDAG